MDLIEALATLFFGLLFSSEIFVIIFWPYKDKHDDFCGYIEFYMTNTFGNNNNNSDYVSFEKYFEENPQFFIDKTAKDKHEKSFTCFKSLNNVWFWVICRIITVLSKIYFLFSFSEQIPINKSGGICTIFLLLICFLTHLINIVYIAEGKRFFEKSATNTGKYYEDGNESFNTCLAFEIISMILTLGMLIYGLILYQDFLKCLSDCCESLCKYLSDCCESFCKCLSDCCGSLWHCLSDYCRKFGDCLSDCCKSFCKNQKESLFEKKKKISQKKIKKDQKIKEPIHIDEPILTNDRFLPSVLPDNRSKEKKIIILYTNIGKDYTNIILEDILETKIYNPATQNERLEKIKNICNKILNENLSLIDYLKNASELGTYIKHSMIYDIFNNKNNFYSNEELMNTKENSNLFFQNALSTFLSHGNVICSIEKKTTNEEETKATLKLISNGLIFQRVINFSYDLGKDKNSKLINDLTEQNSFISEKKAYYSKIFRCEPNDIIVINFKLKSSNISFDIIIIGAIPNLNNLQDQGLINFTYKSLLEACRINPSLFDNNYNNYNGWGKGQKRGPPHHLMDYDPPLGFMGFGLNILNKYDGGDNTWLGMKNVEGEWYIAYHGTRLEFVENIINKGFGAGYRQAYEFDDNINELSKSQYIKCGRGVYCTPKINKAEEYAAEFIMKNSKYKLVFMCRVNPYKIRIAKEMPIYWIVSGDSLSEGNIKNYDDEIRIYRILLKKIN